MNMLVTVSAITHSAEHTVMSAASLLNISEQTITHLGLAFVLIVQSMAMKQSIIVCTKLNHANKMKDLHILFAIDTQQGGNRLTVRLIAKVVILTGVGKMTNKYNGWTNYATWRINLEIFDGMDISEMCWKELDRYELAERLKDSAIELIEETGEGLAVDYALAFIDDVNWREIADSMIETYADDETEAA